MSTLFFDVTALSNVLALIGANLPVCPMREALMSAYAAGLAEYSIANAKAFKVRYGEARRAPSADEILLDAQLRGGRFARGHAIGFFQLAAYNLDDFETPALEATLRMLRIAAGIAPAEMRSEHHTPGVPPTCEASDFEIVRL